VPVFSGDRFPAHAQMIAPGKLLFFPRRAFLGLIGENPALALQMLAVLSRRLREFTRQIENLSLKEVPARLASYLLILSQEQRNPERVTLTISKSQLASIIGTIPETLSRIFARLSGQELISVQGGVIHLLDPEGLADLAHAGTRGD
jgi:CRP/FNR family transcriptional regulator